MSKVLCVGMSTRDHVVFVDRYPGANERVVACRVKKLFWWTGFYCSRYFGSFRIPVAISCVIGDDEDGAAILQMFSREGIDTQHVVIDKTVRTATGTIVVSKSEQTRAIMVQPHSVRPSKPSQSR